MPPNLYTDSLLMECFPALLQYTKSMKSFRYPLITGHAFLLSRRTLLQRSMGATLAALLPGVAPMGRAEAQARGRRTVPGMFLLQDVQYRAFRFFWEKAEATTGLVNDRARNDGLDTYMVASTASTGYALAALPVAVERKWISRAQAETRARRTLNFLLQTMPHVRGWCYHFVDKRNGQRVWNSEVSTIDTTLLVCGALTCGQYLGGDIAQKADALFARLDWNWMRTNGGTQPNKRLVSHGWKPEEGFLPYNWDDYNEGTLLTLLGMGAAQNPLPADCWTALMRRHFTYGGVETLTGGPIFLHQMPHAYLDFRGQRDILGYDYEVCSRNAIQIHRQFCADRASQRMTYRAGYWGLNASDGPQGYRAYGIPAPEDGTISPTGAMASIMFGVQEAQGIAVKMYQQFGNAVWGRYGFANAFNIDADWFDTDVIGIDLGMALLAIENSRTGLVWKWFGSHPAVQRGMAAAGFHITHEAEPRLLRL